jgi:hypothetical protein
LARIEQTIEQRIEHLHMPLAVLDSQQAAQLKENAPEVYELWLKLTEKKADADVAMQRATVDYPLSLAERGQWFGLVGLIAVLGFCGYLASLGGGVQYLAGIIAAVDIVAIIGVFMARNAPR